MLDFVKNKAILGVGCVDLVRFPDPPYGVGRGNEPLRSWEFYFGVKELEIFQWSSLQIGAFWNSAHVRTILTLASPSHIHWLPGGQQFYPTSGLPLRPPPVCHLGILLLSLGFLPIFYHICEFAFLSIFTAPGNHSKRLFEQVSR